MPNTISKDTFAQLQVLVKANPEISNSKLGEILNIGKTSAGKWRKVKAYPAAHTTKQITKKIGISHAIIPDCQVRPGVDISHLRHIGNYLAEKKPDVVVCIGDFADMPSLSSYTIGKADAEGQRYVEDVKSVHRAMDALMTPIRAVPGYNPRLVFTIGNHEDRITREVEANPRLIGKISIDDLGYENYGWEVVPFLKPIKVNGIEYCHYFTSGAMGRPIASAAVLLRERQCSGVQGHVQFTDLSFHKKTGNFGLFCGICYTHDEKYLGFQGNTTRRQIVMLHEVKDGTADPMFVSLGFLRANYNY